MQKYSPHYQYATTHRCIAGVSRITPSHCSTVCRHFVFLYSWRVAVDEQQQTAAERAQDAVHGAHLHRRQHITIIDVKVGPDFVRPVQSARDLGFTSTVTWRWRLTSTMPFRRVLVHCDRYGPPSGPCHRKQWTLLSPVSCPPGWTTAMSCSRVFQPVTFSLCSQFSMLLCDSSPIHQVAAVIYLHPPRGYTPPPCDMSTHLLGRTPRGSQKLLPLGVTINISVLSFTFAFWFEQHCNCWFNVDGIVIWPFSRFSTCARSPDRLSCIACL